MDRIKAAQRPVGGAGTKPIAERLYDFGFGLMTFLASKPAIDFYSVVAGELRRHEELARAFHELGPGRTRENLAALISAASIRDELIACDPGQAAEELFGLWQGFSNFQLSLNIDAAAIRASLPQRIERGVALFMRVYGSKPVTAAAAPRR